LFRNCLMAALRDLGRSRLQSAITIGSLAIGLMAAVITGALTRDAFNTDHFLPGYQQVYFAAMGFHNARGDFYDANTPYNMASYLRQFPGIEAVARLSGGPGVLRHGDVEALEERLSWADPDFFRIYRAPALFGDPGKALDVPDSLVITRAVARKYFSRENVVGETLEFGHEPEYRRQPMVVRAVIEDWPANESSFTSTVFASSLSPLSRMSKDVGTLGIARDGRMTADMSTIVRLAPGTSLDDLNRRAAALIAGFVPKGLPFNRTLFFERSDNVTMSARLRPDNRAILVVMYLVTLVILALSCFNYVNLCVARSVQRAPEVAVRKVAGAGRGALAAQFLGEAVLQALLALCLAVAMAEWALPVVNNFLASGAVLDFWRDPLLALSLVGGAVLVGLVAGAYPALVLSALRPATVLKGWAQGPRAGLLRRALVTLQFAVLVIFLISAVTMYRQNRYATTEAVNVDIDRVVTVQMPSCMRSYLDRVRSLPGVADVACASLPSLGEPPLPTWMTVPLKGGAPVLTQVIPLDFGFLELFGIKPEAGRIFRSEFGDAAPAGAAPPRYVINQSTVRALGYASAQAAIGRAIFDKAPPGLKNGPRPGIIIGVVKDFSLNPQMFGAPAQTGRLLPVVYSLGWTFPDAPASASTLYIRLTGRDEAAALAAIDKAWKQTGSDAPINREFLTEYVHNRQSGLLKIAQAFTVFAGIAMLLACSGLFGVSLLAVERRTKEIGIRKAMGATGRQVAALLLWQFSWPALWANLLAWPLGWFLMRKLLSSLAYAVGLPFWTFLLAGGVVLAIAVATVAGQALVTARQKPVRALRYE